MVALMKWMPCPARNRPIASPRKFATSAPTMPSTVVRRKPWGLFGAGDRIRAISPARKPMMTMVMRENTKTPPDPCGTTEAELNRDGCRRRMTSRSSRPGRRPECAARPQFRPAAVILRRSGQRRAERVGGVPAPMRIVEEGPGERHQIGLSLPDDRLRLIGIGDQADGPGRE